MHGSAARSTSRAARIDAGEPTHVPADTLGIQTDWPASSQRRASMNPDESMVNKISGLDQLFLDSALSGIDPDAPPAQIETVLRSVAGAIAGADPIRREVIRDALIRRLRRAGVSCPVTLSIVIRRPPPREKASPTLTVPLFPNIDPWPERVNGGL